MKSTVTRPSEIVFSLLMMINITSVTWAQTLQFFPSAAAPPIIHSFFSGAGTDIQGFSFTNSAVQLSDYGTIQVAVSAPPGLAWHVTSPSHGPAGQDLPELGFSLSCLTPGQAMGAPFAQIISASMDFKFVLGGAALVSPTFFSLIPGSGNSFSFGAKVGVSGNCAFTSLTLTVRYDTSLVAAAPLDPFYSSRIEYSYHDLLSDPGPQLTLIPVPVPAPLDWQTVHMPDASEVLAFSWTNSNFFLQAGPTVAGPFTNVPGATSPYAVPFKGSQLFFRLQAN